MASETDEVAEDYRQALEDLSSNMRFEISNLTLIARENTEHALAIANVLQQHILKAPPSKKLPSLYVLDSIVKNVGTPYTLYFGRNLFKTFMESYAVVDSTVRRKMEEMLKTWKDPVPGSMDTRPVFSHELVRPIENALMRARAATMPQQAPIPGRSRYAMMPHRNTPTPPAAAASRGPEALSNDIQNLIVATTSEFTQNPNDASIQNRLKALLDLQGIVQRTSLPPDQLEMIKSKVTELAVTGKAPLSQQSTPVAGYVPPHNLPQPPLPPSHPASVTPTMASLPGQKPQVTLESLLGPGARAALMARQAAASQGATSTPPPIAATAVRSPPTVRAETPKPPPQNPLALLEQLRQAGVLSSGTPTNAGGAMSALSAPPPPPSLPPSIPQSVFPPNISSILASAKAMGSQQDVRGATKDPLDEVALKKQPPSDAISGLYDDLGPQCSQCGRRFKTDEEGKKKKAAHMDFHFHVLSRATEAEKRGICRSWFVDYPDWLNSREAVDSTHAEADEGGAGQASDAPKGPQYIPAPDRTSGISNVCPRCQDKFEKDFLQTTQEWVWLDAVLVGNRAYHPSCYADEIKDREGVFGVSKRTPEPVLGKRKAEGHTVSPKIRQLKTSV